MKYYQSSLWFGLALLALVSFALAQANRAEQKTESPTTDAHRALSANVNETLNRQ